MTPIVTDVNATGKQENRIVDDMVQVGECRPTTAVYNFVSSSLPPLFMFYVGS